MRTGLYYFPLLTPLILAGIDYSIRDISSGSSLDFVIALRGLSVSFLFGCFTVDIWGITSTLEKEKSIALSWMIFLCGHLFLYSCGIRLEQHISAMSLTGNTAIFANILLFIVVLLSAVLLIFGREYCWRKTKI